MPVPWTIHPIAGVPRYNQKVKLLDRMDRDSKNPGLKKCLQVHDNDQDATVGA